MSRNMGMRRPSPRPRSRGAWVLVIVVVILGALALARSWGGLPLPHVTPETLYPGTVQQQGDASYANALAQAEGMRISPLTNVKVDGGLIYVRHDIDASDCGEVCAVLHPGDGGWELMLPPGYFWYGNYQADQGTFDPVARLTYWSVPQFASLAVGRSTFAKSAPMPLGLERVSISSLQVGQTGYIARGSLRQAPDGVVVLADGWAAWDPAPDPVFVSSLSWRARPQQDGSITVCVPPGEQYTKASGEPTLKVNLEPGC